MLQILIFLNLFWSIAAWIYDWSKLITIEPYLWPFIAICPIYPLLLALVLMQLYRKKTPNQFLLAFAVIPSITFGVLALIFYPVAMYYQGFSWNAVGQIFWVWFYAGQGIWLFKNYKITKISRVVVSLFTAFILTFEVFTKSYGYLDFSNIPDVLVMVFLVTGFFSIFFLCFLTKFD